MNLFNIFKRKKEVDYSNFKDIPLLSIRVFNKSNESERIVDKDKLLYVIEQNNVKTINISGNMERMPNYFDPEKELGWLKVNLIDMDKDIEIANGSLYFDISSIDHIRTTIEFHSQSTRTYKLYLIKLTINKNYFRITKESYNKLKRELLNKSKYNKDINGK